MAHDFASERSRDGAAASPAAHVQPGKRALTDDLPSTTARDRVQGQRSAGRALPDPVRGKLEQSLGGGNLANVRVHPDSEAATELGTRAFTVGQDVHFAPGQYDPDGAAGQHVLAHEVAHAVQQRDAVVGSELATSSSGDRGEREAHAFADAFSSGETMPIAHAAPASIQCFDGFDLFYAASPLALVAKKTGATDAIGEAIASYSAEGLAALVDSGGQLIAILARVSVELATLVIRILVEEQMWILREAIVMASKSAIVRLILDALSDEQVQEVLWLLLEAGTAPVRKVLLAIYDTGLLQTVGRLLFLLSNDTLHPILQHVGAGVLGQLWKLFRDDVLHYIVAMLDDYWPNGMGIALGGHVGATFGYPIHVRGEYEARVSRLDDKNIHLYRRGEARVAADTGASYGVYYGFGKAGIGVEAGVDAQAGAKAIVIQEFNFPIFDEPETFLALVFSFFLAERSVLGTIGELLFGSIPDPTRYNTRTQFEVRGYAEVAAEANAGLKVPGANTESGKHQVGDSAPDTGKTPWWLKLAGLSTSIIGQAGANAGIGVELTQDWEGVTDRSQGPKQVKLGLFVGAEAGIEILHSLPLPFPLPQLPKLGGGLGLRLNYLATPAPGGEADFAYQNMQLSATNGDLERYTGAASELTIEVTKDMLTSLHELAAGIGDTQVTIRRRASVGAAFNQKLLRRTQSNLRSLLPNSRGTAFTLEGYITFAFKLTGHQAKAILERLISAVGKLRAKHVGEVLSDLTTFLTTGEVPTYLAGEVDAIATTLAACLSEITLHGRSGLMVAGGAHLSAGAKGRLDYSAGGYLTIDKDLLGMLDGLSASEVAELLRDKLQDAEDLLFPADESDPLPVR